MRIILDISSINEENKKNSIDIKDNNNNESESLEADIKKLIEKYSKLYVGENEEKKIY